MPPGLGQAAEEEGREVMGPTGNDYGLVVSGRRQNEESFYGRERRVQGKEAAGKVAPARAWTCGEGRAQRPSEAAVPGRGRGGGEGASRS